MHSPKFDTTDRRIAKALQVGTLAAPKRTLGFKLFNINDETDANDKLD